MENCQHEQEKRTRCLENSFEQKFCLKCIIRQKQSKKKSSKRGRYRTLKVIFVLSLKIVVATMSERKAMQHLSVNLDKNS
jgi:hypothetical protein